MYLTMKDFAGIFLTTGLVVCGVHAQAEGYGECKCVCQI
jgi:hypothetical protein